MPVPIPVVGPGGPLVPGVRKIVVLRSNGIGDLVVALPALHSLRAAYPDAHITYLGTPWHPELLRDRPGPWDRVLVVPPYPGVRDAEGATKDSPEVQEFFAQQREEGYDLAVQLHGGGGNSNPFVRALGARLNIGSQDVGAPPMDRTIPYVYYQHEVHRFLEVVGLVGAAPVELEPTFPVTDADRTAADDALDGLSGPLVAIHPGATDPRRRWPAESFAEVGEELAARGAQVVVVGHGDDDEQAAKVICDAVRGSVNLVGRLSMSAMVGVLERVAVVLGNDSGPRHLAGAVGTATVGVYWCGNVINAGPVSRTRHRISVSFRTACPVCGIDQTVRRCEHDSSWVADVPVDDVLRHALEVFAREAG